MISSRRPPTFMPTTPLSQPGITCPAPSLKVKGWLVHDDWITLPDEYVASTYCTVTLSPGAAAAPVPAMRSALWSEVGGVPDGTVTLGAWPAVPAGDWSAAGIGRMASSGLWPGTVVVELVPATLEAFVLVVAPDRTWSTARSCRRPGRARRPHRCRAPASRSEVCGKTCGRDGTRWGHTGSGSTSALPVQVSG